MISIKKLCDFIWAIEQELCLLDMESDGVKFWLVSRMNIYYQLAEHSGLLSKPHNLITERRKFLASLNYTLNALKSYSAIKSNLDAVIVEHPRGVQLDDGRVVDIYTHYLREDLEKNGVIYQSIEPAYMGKHLKTKHSETIYIDGLSLFAKLKSYFIRLNDVSKLQQVSDLLNKRTQEALGFEFDYFRIFEYEVKNFISKYNVARWFFIKSKPKKLYLAVSYGYFHFVKAAKDLGIEVVELQHGTYSKYHLGYSYPVSKPDLNYIPDEFYAWNGFWKECNVLPISKNKVTVYNFRYGEEKLEKYQSLTKKKQITVISQGVIANELSKKLTHLINEFPNYKIYFKLHPGEYGRWKDYPVLKELVDCKKVTVLEGVDLYKLLAESEYQVGVFSTAIFEGIDLGCKTILYSLPGIEYMEDLIESGEIDIVYE